MESRKCPHCKTDGILIMSDGRCPNCKELLIETSNSKPRPISTEGHKSGNIHLEQPAKTSRESTAQESSNRAGSPITLFFQDTERLSFPSVCVGCGSTDPCRSLNWTVFSKPSLSAGAKAFKAANILFGLASGGAGGGIAGALGGAKGGAALGDSLKKARATVLHTLPICESCLSQFSSTHLKEISEASKELFQDKGIDTPAFSVRMDRGCACWTVNETFARRVIELNKNRVFLSLGDCASYSMPPRGQAELDGNGAGCLPTIDPASLTKYESIYGQKLSPMETAIVDSWHSKMDTPACTYTYPDIPEKKLRNALSSYAQPGTDSLIIALYDSTVLGSAKEGALFTSVGVAWKMVSGAGSIRYAELPPSSIRFKSYMTKKNLSLGPDQSIDMFGYTEKSILALCGFLFDAATYSRLT